MLKVTSNVLLFAYIVKMLIFVPQYPDALIVLFLSACFALEKYLKHRAENNIEKQFQDEIKKDVQDIKNAMTSLKIAKGNILGR